ncbi:hypothetical protein QQS21_002075 [Conoideocrella luteorostrata]|uniref:Metalloprotease n=1 Tax=Conoideocrella luteorostrata TaxID=1105319 RepID=A0AAJ0G1M6_9HYPO|nr:hypothetical protein QQS21_002075 [Conoideocrella luteorostrata]
MHLRVLAIAATAPAILAPAAAVKSDHQVTDLDKAKKAFCGFEAPRVGPRRMEESLYPRLNPTEDLSVDVYVHVLARPEEKKHNESEFLLTRRDLERQMDVINKSFKPTNISFGLKEVDWIVTEQLTSYEDEKIYGLVRNEEFKSLRKGGKSALNLYFFNATDTVGGLTGRRSKPDEISGCFVSSNTVPGGANPRFNMGKTAVHEIGHWLGCHLHSDLGINCGSELEE